MALPLPQYTPVVAPTGLRVHAATLTEPTKTACGREFSGWSIALRKVNCNRCKMAIFHDVRPKQKRKRKR